MRFTATAVDGGKDDDIDTHWAAAAEHADGTGMYLMFQCALDDPDEQEISLRMDTHCLVTAGQGTAYGCVNSIELHGKILHIMIEPNAMEPLGLDEPEIEVNLAADHEAVERFCEALGEILTYGRTDAQPIMTGI